MEKPLTMSVQDYLSETDVRKTHPNYGQCHSRDEASGLQKKETVIRGKAFALPFFLTAGIA